MSQQISSYPVLNSPSSMSTKLGITTVFTLISTLWTKLVIHSIITEKNFLRIFNEKQILTEVHITIMATPNWIEFYLCLFAVLPR